MDFLTLELKRYGWNVNRTGKVITIIVDPATSQDYSILREYFKIYASPSELQEFDSLYDCKKKLKNICITLSFG